MVNLLALVGKDGGWWTAMVLSKVINQATNSLWLY